MVFTPSNPGESILEVVLMYYLDFNFFIFFYCAYASHSHMNFKDCTTICHYLFVLEVLAQSDQTSNWVDHI